MTATAEAQGRRLKRRKAFGKVSEGIFFACTLVAIIVLVVLLLDIWADGASVLSMDFLTSFTSRIPANAGIKAGLAGTLWVLSITAIFSFPLGVATAIWLEEYAPRGWITQIIQTNVANLAAVPSIVYGILGLAVFVRAFSLGGSVLSAGLTLALLVLPVIIIASQEAIRAVPNSIRLGAYALGATRWQTVRQQVLPMAFPGILTGAILALSRAVGETAPLVVIGALVFVPFVPSGPMDDFTVLPFQIFNWISRPQPEFHQRAAGGIIVLMAVLMAFNLIAVLLRNRYARRSS